MQFRLRMIASITLFIFLVAQGSFVNFSFAQTSFVSGTIQKIEPMGGGQYQLVLEHEDRTETYIVDSSTLIQAVVPAKDIQKGSEILLVPKVSRKGVIKRDSPFKNMPPAVRKALGLPNIPSIPEVPKVPEVPTKSKMTGLPSIPQVPKVPTIPKPARAPGKEPAPAGRKPAPAAPQPSKVGPETEADGEIQPSGLGGMPREEMAERREKEPEIQEPPREARSSAIKPEALSEATPTFEKVKGKRIKSLEKVSDGVQMELISEEGESETVTLSADEKVLQILNAKDLKKKLSVKLEIIESPEGKFVQRLTII